MIMWRCLLQVKKDAIWEDMAAGYPKPIVQGAMQKFVFRFPKFTTSGIYDPIIDVGAQPAQGGGAQATLGYPILLIVASLFTLWLTR